MTITKRIRAYISNGLRRHFAVRVAQLTKDRTIEKISQGLKAHGVSECVIQEAVDKMIK